MKGILASVLVLLFSASLAGAGSIALTSDGDSSTSHIGAYTGVITYNDLDTLTIVLSNTTPAGGGYLTGFVFNIEGAATATLVPNPTGGFEDLGAAATHTRNAQPFGTYEAGAALGGAFEGGNPQGGIVVGDSATFVFHVTGGADLTVEDFFVTTAQASKPFVARFRAIDIGAGSDKVPANGTLMIPLPPAAWSGVSMLGVLGAFSLKRKVLGLLRA